MRDRINFVGVFYIQDGARIADSVSRGKVASTYERGSWIDLGDLTGKTVSCMHEASHTNLLLISVVFLVPFCDYSFHRNCNTMQSFCIRNVRRKLENAIFLMVRCKSCEIQFVNKKTILHSSRCF